MIVGGLLFLLSRRSRRTSVKADRGSVAIGGSNLGSVTNINLGSEQTHTSGHALTYISIVVELIGIAAVIWHATHLAAK